FEIMAAKGIRGEQAIIAHVPPGRVPRVFRMVKHGNANNFSLYRPVVVAPIGFFAPCLVVALTGAVENMAVLAGSFEFDAFGDADRHRAFFGIAESQISVGSVQSDVKIEETLVPTPGIVDSERALVGANNIAVSSDPFVVGFEKANILP